MPRSCARVSKTAIGVRSTSLIARCDPSGVAVPKLERLMRNILRATLAGLLMLLVACGDAETPAENGPIFGDTPGGTTAAEPQTSAMVWHRSGQRATLVEAVETWNDNITTFSRLAFVPQPVEARMSAMANTSVHDVLNAVDRRFQPYAYDGKVRRPVSVEAAIATAAYDVLADAARSLATSAALDFITPAYNDYMTALGECDEVTRGKELGHEAAVAMLAQRAGDGSAGPPVETFTSSGEPGVFRSPIATATALSGIQALSYWGAVKPFVIVSTSQFRSPPMYGAATAEDAVKTAQYLADYDEVRRLGGMVSSERTQKQLEVGYFWIESTVQRWNRIARALAEKKDINAWRLARLLAHVSLAGADSYIASFGTIYHYKFWRPVTAIRLGNLDPVTPPTASDLAWQASSLLMPALGGTPPIPEYDSGHSMAGAAAAQAILASLNGSTAFMVESPALPGQPRSFQSVRTAALENADSRIYLGFDFRHATEEGLARGLDLGRYVGGHALQRAQN